MDQQLERVIIALNPDGTFKGASSTDFKGIPIPLDLDALNAVVPQLNAALMTRIGELETALKAATTEIETAKAERDSAQASLKEHQSISDSLVTAARAAIDSQDPVALQNILTQASLFGKAREVAKLEAEAAELEAKAAEAKARASALAAG